MTTVVDEALEVHTAVALLGPSASGKSCLWKILIAAQTKHDSRKRSSAVILPNLFSIDELYGFFDSSHSWREGIVHKLLHGEATASDGTLRVFIFDERVERHWCDYISSLIGPERQVVLSNQGKLQFPKTAKVILESADLQTASPGLISHCGVMVLDRKIDQRSNIIGSWLRTRSHELFDLRSKEELFKIIERYVVPCFAAVIRVAEGTSEPILALRLTWLLNGILSLKTVVKQADRLEQVFAFALIWTCAAYLPSLGNARLEFSGWFRRSFDRVKIPNEGTVFDYFCDVGAGKFLPWRDTSYFVEPAALINPRLLFLPSNESASCLYFGSVMMNQSNAILYFGPSGTGKSALVSKLVGLLDNVKFVVRKLSTSKELATFVLLADKQIFNTGNAPLHLFIDDLELASETVLDLLRFALGRKEIVDYGSYKNVLIRNVSFICCSENLAVGSRLMSLLCPFEYSPSSSSKAAMINTVMTANLEKNGFAADALVLIKTLVRASVSVLDQLRSRLSASTVTQRYGFDVRAALRLAHSFQLCTPAGCEEPFKLVLFWLHEVNRTFADALLKEERPVLYKVLEEVAKKEFSQFFISRFLPSTDAVTEPVIFCHFAEATGIVDLSSPTYEKVEDISKTTQILRELILDITKDVVLVDSSMLYVAKIARLLSLGCRGICIMGPGGTGKGLLTRLAARTIGYRLESLEPRDQYSTSDFRAKWESLSLSAGIRMERVILLISEQDVADHAVINTYLRFYIIWP